MDYIERNENENENENSIEIEMEIEEDDNKSEDKIIIKQKNNKPSLADFIYQLVKLNFLINQLVENKNKILNQKNFLVKNKKNNNVCRDIIVYNEKNNNNLKQKNLDYFFNQTNSIIELDDENHYNEQIVTNNILIKNKNTKNINLIRNNKKKTVLCKAKSKNNKRSYYSKEGIGVYQGDPLSPLLFGFITRFLLDKLKPLAIHVQMFADDLILIMKGSLIEINYHVEKIFKMIRDFGMNPNKDKTKKTTNPKEILYLGIWLDKQTHLKFNLDKVKTNFKKLINILQQKKFTNGLKIHFFKAVLHSQLLYGLEIFDLTQKDFNAIDVWINKKIAKFLLINPHSPRLIYKTEAKIDTARITIYKRRFKLIQKLKILDFNQIVDNLKFREQKFENINWQTNTLKELEIELEKYRIKQLENSPSWKVHKYLRIISIQNNINKQQRYLKWKGSTSILKLRNFTNYLNRYSYVMNKDKSKFCKLCKKSKNLDIIEDLDHFLWNCPAYENNRRIWISELKKLIYLIY
ncbi:hypothetical protein M0813_10086 [Anaeramoeba flamelloides]|uniref:Reverse transcriptase domain-containing protein n=1 Tax=Anaeramoeba flamelloides TaxID=1746091 RepID=A0ABQ8X4V9_9EUKA|nr:hypothetical protein M0813_10086 [Anaeramoeba flamelloides]